MTFLGVSPFATLMLSTRRRLALSIMSRPATPLPSEKTHQIVEREDQSSKRKGKQRADPPTPIKSPLTSLLQEALDTPISSTPSSIDSAFEGPSISPLPRAAQPPILQSMNHPRLVSQLTRATLPISSLTYVSTSNGRNVRSASHTGLPQLGESSTAWRKSMTIDDTFPDLDPATGLPLDSPRRSMDSFTSTAPSLHLQRTITSLLDPPQEESSSFPTLSSLGGMIPKLSGGRPRSFSTSAAQGDWTSWATGWWGSGNKKKVDRMMSDEDKAETVEEEKDKLRKKCMFLSLNGY